VIKPVVHPGTAPFAGGALQRRTLLAGLATAPAWAQSPRLVSPLDQGVVIEGRSATTTDGSVRLGFPGVGLRCIADTARLALVVTAHKGQWPTGEGPSDSFIDVQVDGGAPRRVRLALGRQEVVLYQGPPGRHRVDVTRRTESWQGLMDVHGLLQADDRPLSAPPLPARRLMFIGDSITCGAGLDVARDSAEAGPQTSDATRAFGKLLAARFDAQCHLVSYGGRGLIRDWQGLSDINNAPVFYERALPDDPNAPWEHRRYVPHAIGICLGTNDFNQGIPDREAFVGAYERFVRKLQHDAPGAAILIIDSPMTDDSPDRGPRATVLRGYLDAVVQRIGDPRVRHAPLRKARARASDAHPIAEDHVDIADQLEPHLRAVLQPA